MKNHFERGNTAFIRLLRGEEEGLVRYDVVVSHLVDVDNGGSMVRTEEGNGLDERG